MQAEPWYLALIDTDTGGDRCDVTPLFADAAAFEALVSDLAAQFDPAAIDAVAGIDALGFILGGALARTWRKGFVAIRKAGKLPVPADRVEFVDYTDRPKALELRHDALRPGQRVVLVDEWIETGAQVRAALTLIERQGAHVAGIACVNADMSASTRELFEKFNLRAAMCD